jgi:hypothetical protein
LKTARTRLASKEIMQQYPVDTGFPIQFICIKRIIGFMGTRRICPLMNQSTPIGYKFLLESRPFKEIFEASESFFD